MTIVDTGLEAAAGLLVQDPTETAFQALAVGTDSTGAGAGDTALGGEVMRQASTESLTTDSATHDTSELVATFDFTGSHAITEYGTFNDTASGAGTMLNRIVDAPVNVSSGDSIELTMNIIHS